MFKNTIYIHASNIWINLFETVIQVCIKLYIDWKINKINKRVERKTFIYTGWHDEKHIDR